ncbi:MAG: transglycosylase domain-containing protein [Acidobacteriota bacterium]
MRRPFYLRLLLFLLKWLFVPICLFVAAVVGLYFAVRNNVPDISPLKSFTPLATTRLFDRGGALIAQFQDPRIRLWVTLDKVPKEVIDAVTCAEDPNFFTHGGVDVPAIWEALKIDIQHMAYVRGASTITQQLMKNLFLSREKTLTRKIKEVVLSTNVENLITKREILEQYLNQVEWGENLHGIEAASRYYFGKPVESLRMDQGALLAGMLPNPKYYNPYTNLSKLRVRQRIILGLMWKYHKISKPQYEEAIARPVVLATTKTRPYVASELKERYRTKPVGYRLIIEDTIEDYLGPFRLWQGGLTLHTTLDLDTVKQAERFLGKPERLIRRRFALLRKGGAVVGIATAPTKSSDPKFDVWIKERGIVVEIVTDRIPWDQILVAPRTEAK